MELIAECMPVIWEYGGFKFYKPGFKKYCVGRSLETNVVFDCDFRTYQVLKIQAATKLSLAYAYALYLSVNERYFHVFNKEVLDYQTYLKRYKPI